MASRSRCTRWPNTSSRRATNAPNERLRSLFELIERHGRDRAHGGYREFLLDDWSLPARDGVSYMDTPATVKTLNTNLHLCEALTRVADVRADAAVRDALARLMWVLGSAVVRNGYGVCDDQHAEDWSPPPRADRRPITYGLDLESIWLAIEASARLDVPSAPLLDLHETIFFNCWRYGFDHARGGFYYQGPPGRFATERMKALVGRSRSARVRAAAVFADASPGLFRRVREDARVDQSPPGRLGSRRVVSARR